MVSAAKVASRGRKENPKNNVKIYFIQDLQKRYSLWTSFTVCMQVLGLQKKHELFMSGASPLFGKTLDTVKRKKKINIKKKREKNNNVQH